MVKLRSLLGDDEARRLCETLLSEIGLSSLTTPDDQLRFGDALVKRGGLLEAVGRSVKVRALLHGARAQR